MPNSVSRALAAEALGTAMLLIAVVGSALMGARLTHDAGLVLLANSFVTAFILFAIIVAFAPLSGAHFNPAVTLIGWLERRLSGRLAGLYCLSQIVGAFAGVWIAHAMFGDAIFAWGEKARSGWSQDMSEFVAAFGLVLFLIGVRGRALETVAAVVAVYIGAAYWFTASTSFANPAATLARSLTPSLSGIRLSDAPAFVAAQFAGAIAAWAVAQFLFSAVSAKID